MLNLPIPAAIKSLTWSQTNSFLRHVYTAAGSILSTLVVVGLVTQGDATKLNDAVQSIGDGFAKIVASITALIPIASGIYAAWTASRTSRLKAMAADPQIERVIVTSPALAEAIPSNKVVSSSGA